MHKKFYFIFSTILFLVTTSCFSITNENATFTVGEPSVSKVSATMELAADGVEDPLFDNIDETRKNKTADYPYNPDYPTNAKVSKLATGLGETVGPATILAVKQGDEMSVSTDYYFTTPALPQTNQTAEQILSGIIGSFTTAGVSTLPLDDLGNVINPFTDANSQAATGLNSFIQNSFDSLDTSLPQGYLVTMFFDNDLNLVPEYSGVQRVTEAGSLQKLAVINQKMPSDGFYYTYVTNQSAQVTQFDNLTYIHIEGVLKEANDYYPYGLLCSSATIASVNTNNNYKFQDKEFNRKEFVNTWGLDWYNHGARMYDPELGRWHVQDPALQFANPYLAMGNNPVSMTDPDGQFVHILVGAVLGGVINLALHQEDFNNNGGSILKAFMVGAAAGGLAAATGGATLAATGLAGAAGGAVAGAASATVASPILGLGNQQIFGSPYSVKQFGKDVLIGGVTGGIFGGVYAWKKGLNPLNGAIRPLPDGFMNVDDYLTASISENAPKLDQGGFDLTGTKLKEPADILSAYDMDGSKLNLSKDYIDTGYEFKPQFHARNLNVDGYVKRGLISGVYRANNNVVVFRYSPYAAGSIGRGANEQIGGMLYNNNNWINATRPYDARLIPTSLPSYPYIIKP